MGLPIFESFSLNAVLMDLCYASLFLILGQFLRKHIKIFQALYLPAPLIGGIIAWFFGPMCFELVPFSAQASNYPNVLIIALIASMGLGYNGKHEESIIRRIAEVRDSFFAFGCGHCFQFGGFILLGYVLSKIIPGVNQNIGYLLPAGFDGGHGYATTVGTVLQEVGGFEGATGIGITFATVGLLIGVIGGIIQINIAARIGATRFIQSSSAISVSQKTGWIPEHDPRPSIGTATMDSSSIDPLTWHICLLAFVSGVGYCLNIWFDQLTGISVPALVWALICAYIIQALFDAAGIGHHVDKATITRVAGSITDYLVFFGLVTLRADVVIENWLPILILCIFGILWCVFEVWILGPMWFNSNWFERSMFMYGMYTGVIATGVVLLRVLDPENKSRTLDEYYLAYIGLTWQTPLVIGIFTGIAAAGQTVLVGCVTLGIGFAMLIAAYFCKALHGFKREYWNSEKFEAAMEQKLGTNR